MRIAIVSRIYRPEPSAASFFLGAVADELVATGHEVDVLTVRPPRGFSISNPTSRVGERVRMFPVLRDSNGYVKGYLQYMSFDLPLAFRLLFLRKPATVFVEPPPTTGAVVRVICWLRRIPYVYDAADIWSDAAIHSTSSPFVVRMLRKLECFAMRGAAQLVTISQGVVDRVRDLGVSTPATVTGFGADTQAFHYSEETVEPVFTYAGTYTALHGAEIIIEAFAEFSQTHPGYRLRFIGNGTGQEQMRERAKALGVHIDFQDQLPAEELQLMLARSTASLSTLRPGAGYDYAFTSKVYSALATGCPSVFAGTGPTGPFIDEANSHARAGTAVDYDVAELADALRSIADNPWSPSERSRLAEWAKAEHSLAAVGQRVASVVIAASRGASNAQAETTPTPEEPSQRPGLFARLANWAVKNRSRMPRWMSRVMESAARNPDGLVGLVSARLLGGGSKVPATEVPTTPVRIYIAPTNYAEQGYRWARALEAADPKVGAQNLAVELPGGYDFAADSRVPIAVVNASSEWASEEWQAARQFTHVLVEAERSLFGREFGRSLDAEVQALTEAGVSVAFLAHGTDVRDPQAHARRTPWSPYPEDPRTELLQRDANKNIALLRRHRLPTFVSTPDLLVDVPEAIWCPVVLNPERFATDSPAFSGPVVRVVHASSNPLQKGSHRIDPALKPLVDAGQLEYELITSTLSSEMPAVFAASDIVLDQFRLGSYGVAACEAMAAGRVVVGHVLPQVREHVETTFGISLPIVEATTDSLHDVIAELIRDPARAREIATAGPAFVARVHSGPASAEVLLEGWIRA